MIRHPDQRRCRYRSGGLSPWRPMLGVIVVLAGVLAGCAPARNLHLHNTSAAKPAIAMDPSVPGLTPTAPVPASHPDAQQETLQEFVARAIAQDIGGVQSYLIAYTTVEDEQDLYRGTSASKDAIRQCWLYRAGASHACTRNDIEQTFFGQAQQAPWPSMRFAIAYTHADKVLVLLDYFYDHDRKDPIDGYRIVLTRDHRTWRELSRRQVY